MPSRYATNVRRLGSVASYAGPGNRAKRTGARRASGLLAARSTPREPNLETPAWNPGRSANPRPARPSGCARAAFAENRMPVTSPSSATRDRNPVRVPSSGVRRHAGAGARPRHVTFLPSGVETSDSAKSALRPIFNCLEDSKGCRVRGLEADPEASTPCRPVVSKSGAFSKLRDRVPSGIMRSSHDRCVVYQLLLYGSARPITGPASPSSTRFRNATQDLFIRRCLRRAFPALCCLAGPESGMIQPSSLTKETPRLCRGGSSSLTFQGVHQRNSQA